VNLCNLYKWEEEEEDLLHQREMRPWRDDFVKPICMKEG
jgi:hypothetical protein